MFYSIDKDVFVRILITLLINKGIMTENYSVKYIKNHEIPFHSVLQFRKQCMIIFFSVILSYTLFRCEIFSLKIPDNL